MPAVAAGDYYMVQQSLEGQRISDLQWGTANAKQAVFRLALNCIYGVARPFCVAFRNTAATHSLVYSLTTPGSSVWSEHTLVLPPCTVGTWATGNASALAISIVSACGTTYQTATTGAWVAGNFLGTSAINVIPSSSNFMQFSDVGFYADPNNTGRAPPFEIPDIRVVTTECQRYWQKQLGSIGVGLATAAGTPNRAAYPNQAVMRAVPLSSLAGTPRGWDQATAPNITGIATNYSNTYVFEHNFNAASAMTAGRAAALIDMTPSVYIVQAARI